MNERVAESLIPRLWEDLSKENTKIAKKAISVLDREGIKNIMRIDDYFYYEFYAYGETCPEYIYNYLKKFIERKYKIKYLYDVIWKEFAKNGKIFIRGTSRY